jgi:curved DNA-binding protein CbpA
MDAWETLGLRPDAEPEVVEAAIRALLLKYHPDKAGPGAASRFRKIHRAAQAVRSGVPLERDPLEDERLRARLRTFGEFFGRK